MADNQINTLVIWIDTQIVALGVVGSIPTGRPTPKAYR